MESEIDQLSDNHLIDSDKIPNFLKVLCILTFVGAGFGILGGASNLLLSDLTETSLKLSSSMLDASPANELFGFDFEQMIVWQKYINIAGLLGAILCLVGALIMWKRKKIGFYIYAPGAIFPSIVAIMGMKYMFTGLLGSLASIGGYGSFLFGIAFVVMYGLNLKHMNK